MSPSFDFSFGEPDGDDAAGRWIHGSVVCKTDGDGYRFKADLWRRHFSSTVQSHPVRLDVANLFCADDFAAYIRLISSGNFETTSRVFCLDETDGLDWAAASAILNAIAVETEPGEHHHQLFLNLTSLEEQLEQVRKRELLGLALARF